MFRQQLTEMSRVIYLALALAGVACGSDGDCSADISATLNTFIPSGPWVSCTNAATFEVEGREVRLTHAEYGIPPGAATAEALSEVCGIEDPTAAGPELFYSLWYRNVGPPAIIAIDCPDLPSNQNETWPSCVPPGLMNPVVGTTAFRSWAEEQARTSGPFRFCVYHYAADDSWP